MKNPKYEILARSKKGNNVFMVLEDNKEKVAEKLNGALKKGFPCLVICNREDGTRTGKRFGSKVDWSKYSRIVKVTFGDRKTFTYRTSSHWEVGDGFVLRTPRGNQNAIVAVETKYVHESVITALEDEIGYDLKIIEEVIVK